MPAPFHADLTLARFLPRHLIGPATVPVVRTIERMTYPLLPSSGRREVVDDHVTAQVYGGDRDRPGRPALLWLHGGGHVIGHPRQDERYLTRVAETLDAVVASVDYRLAMRHPFPASVEDAHAALCWLAARPDVDASRIAIGGASAGGGLAASLALLARERGEVQPVFQLLVAPMLDDRSSRRTDLDDATFRLWDRTSNRFAWHRYLGGVDPDLLPPWAVPGRCTDLTGLPPAWIGVGDLDLFLSEDTAYAQRLEASSVSCTLTVVPGAYHGFNVFESRAGVSRRFNDETIDALTAALVPSAA